MYTIDIPKVKGKITEKGYTRTSFSDKLEVSRTTLANYLKKPDSIPYRKLAMMVNLLCDNDTEILSIFFSKKAM